MKDYILVLLADVLLAATLLFQKKYQKSAGVSINAGLAYNVVTGVFSAAIFLGINKFSPAASLFSLLMAALFASLLVIYILIGFRIMKKGSMSLYTLFLMTGGMTLPYIWGLFFLNEELTLIRTIGLVVIVLAIALSNTGAEKPDKKQMLMCIVVFILNGGVSVVAKMHQVSPLNNGVSSLDFVFWVNIFKAILCFVVLLCVKDKGKNDECENFGIKQLLPVLFAAAAADGISFMLQLNGAVNLPATVLYPIITGGSIVMTSLAGVLVYKEKLSKRQWASVIICLAGTCLFL